jgi:superfamily II RNA helicase
VIIFLGIPTHLQSQFRLTYAMILTLLRADSISVEGMMQNSFRELGHQLRAERLKVSLQSLESQLGKSKEPQGPLVPQLTQFFKAADSFIREWNAVAVSCLVLKLY